ncbi:MAG: glycoside hydrolase family 2 TIM barrel-domain containing protein [Pirellulaceae bacterium]
MGRWLLNFEAVDYRCEVWVNGSRVGSHQGGNTPFSFDVSEVVEPGLNELVVRVEDDTEGWQLRGKQTLDPNGIWYTQVSGIWQTVWLEPVASTYLENLKIGTDAATGTITLRPTIGGTERPVRVRVTVHDGADAVLIEEGSTEGLVLSVPKPKLWSPSSPFLYGLTVELLDESGAVLDEVRSYAGIRTVGKERDADGHWRFTLNGEPIFHWGPLDQGWWPDGLLTPPSDEAMRFDIEWLKAAGFNMIRKHIKVEPRRYYYHCDRLGMLMWQDQVSGGQGPRWTHLEPGPVDAQWPAEAHEQYMVELERMVDTLENHPCIVVWVPFNEAWGQHSTEEVGRWIARRDATRLVNIASGGNFWPVGDVVDEHSYPHPSFPFDLGGRERYEPFIKVVGEFGGHGYAVPGHVWDEDRETWGYGGLPRNEDEYRLRYVESLRILNELRAAGIAGAVYTQTTDVEGEVNGLMTYDRKIIKIPARELRSLHQVLFE